MSTAARDLPTDTAPRRWAAPVAVLAVGAFAMGTDSFVLAGILPQLASGLHVSTSSAGQVVTAFALTYAVLAPFLAAATHRVPRRLLIVIALVVFIGGNMFAGLAPNLPVLILGRIIAAIGAALYTPTANGAAIALAGPARRGTALSVVLGGLATGTVFGVPAGTALGQRFGWQVSLYFIGAVALVALIALLTTLPRLPIAPAATLSQRLGVMVNRRVLSVVIVSTLASGSGILFYTYIAEVLGQTAHLRGGGLTVALVLWGAGGAAGAFCAGPLADRIGPRATLVAAITATGGAILLLAVAGNLWLAAPLLVIGGGAGWAVNTPTNHLVSGLVPHAAPVAISFNSSGTYLGQALGAGIGGVLLAGGIQPAGLCIAAAIGSAATLALFLPIPARRTNAG